MLLHAEQEAKVNSHLTVKSKFLIFCILSVLLIVLTGCDAITANVVAEKEIQMYYFRCSDGAGVHLVDYCIDPEINEIKLLFSNERYITVDSVKVTVFGTDGEYLRDKPINLEPSFKELLKMQYPIDKVGILTEVKVQPYFRNANGLLMGCDRELLSASEFRDC